MFLKFIIITFILIWVVSKVGGLVIRTFFGGMANQSRQHAAQQQYQQKRPADGNVHIDYVPKKGKQNDDKSDFKGGDYVDYEEV